MFDLESSIAEWRKELSASGLNSRERLDELENHLREDIADQLRSGITPGVAFEAAALRLGSAEVLRDEFTRMDQGNHSSRWRFVSSVCLLSGIFLAGITWWTLYAFEPNPLSQVAGLVLCTTLAIYVGSLPFWLPFVPSTYYARFQKGIGVATLLAQFWVLLALLTALNAVHMELSLSTQMVLWSLFDASILTVIAQSLLANNRQPINHYLLPLPILDSFTPEARQSIAFAFEGADELNHDFVGTEHALIGLLEVNDSTIKEFLQAAGIESRTIDEEIAKLIEKGAPGAIRGTPPCTPRLHKALELAAKEAKAFNNGAVKPEHILLGLLREGSGVAARVLTNLGITVQNARETLAKRKKPGQDRSGTAGETGS